MFDNLMCVTFCIVVGHTLFDLRLDYVFSFVFMFVIRVIHSFMKSITFNVSYNVGVCMYDFNLFPHHCL